MALIKLFYYALIQRYLNLLLKTLQCIFPFDQKDFSFYISSNQDIKEFIHKMNQFYIKNYLKCDINTTLNHKAIIESVEDNNSYEENSEADLFHIF